MRPAFQEHLAAGGLHGVQRGQPVGGFRACPGLTPWGPGGDM